MLDVRGRWTLAGLLVAVTLGFGCDIPALMGAGVCGLCTFVAYVLRLVKPRLRGHRIWGVQAEIAVVQVEAHSRRGGARHHSVEQEVPLHFRLTCPASFAGCHVELWRVITTPGLSVRALEPSTEVEPTQGAVLRCRAIAQAAAVHHVVGLHVLLRDPLGWVRREAFLPCAMEFAALPRSLPLTIDNLPETRRHAPRRAVGERVDRRPGMGDELRELREHRPGDPFKHIAWKASARRGQLVSRAFEQERARSVYVVLDTGPSMRRGAMGETALDIALDLSHSLAEQAALSSVPFGMALVDGAHQIVVPPGEGYLAVRRVDQALLDVRREVHERVTPLADEALVGRVAKYLDACEDAAILSGGDGLSFEWFKQRAVMSALARLPARERTLGSRGVAPSARTDMAILRRFCRTRGISLPVRPVVSPEERVSGLVKGVQQVFRSRLGPFALIVISDFHGLGAHATTLWRALVRAREGGHVGMLIALRPSANEWSDALRHDVGVGGSLRRAAAVQREDELRSLSRAARSAGCALMADPSPRQLAAAWRRMVLG